MNPVEVFYASPYNSPVNQLQKNLQYLIEKHGTNPTALAAATGVTQPTLHRILTGESKDPRTANLEKLANYFDVSVEYLRSADVEAFDHIPFVEEPTPEAPAFETVQIKMRNPRRDQAQASHAVGREFLDALTPGLQQHAYRSEVYRGQGYRFDYCSEKVVAELARWPGGKAQAMHFLHSLVRRVLWKLSCHRLLLKGVAADRHYVLFIVAKSVQDLGVLPVSALARVSTEAHLHGIEVIWSEPAEAADWINRVESGEITPSEMFDDFNDDDDDDTEQAF